MRLLELSDMAGRPMYWVNADHLALVQRHDTRVPTGIQVVAELKIDGVPLFRTPVGTFTERDDADDAWASFLEHLQQGS